MAALFFNTVGGITLRATVITDASFCHIKKEAGWAAWVRIDGMNRPIKRYGSFKICPNSSYEAERLAAINGIYIAKQHGATDVLVQTDCISVVDLMTGVTKKSNRIEEWIRDLKMASVDCINLTAKHVKGHTRTSDARSYVNRWCDKYANKGRLS